MMAVDILAFNDAHTTMAFPNEKPPEMRHIERFPLAVDAQIRRGSSKSIVKILDISVSGVRLQAAHSLRQGEAFWLKLPLIESREVKVAWANQFVVGCEFAQPLHPSVLENIIRSIG